MKVPASIAKFSTRTVDLLVHVPVSTGTAVDLPVLNLVQSVYTFKYGRTIINLAGMLVLESRYYGCVHDHSTYFHAYFKLGESGNTPSPSNFLLPMVDVDRL